MVDLSFDGGAKYRLRSANDNKASCYEGVVQSFWEAYSKRAKDHTMMLFGNALDRNPRAVIEALQAIESPPKEGK
jgi:hypothetical protein